MSTKFVYGRQARRLFFQAHPDPPWVCYFCGVMIEQKRWLISPGRVDWIDVHHVDGERQNNDLENLRAAHHSCHSEYHAILRVSNP